MDDYEYMKMPLKMFPEHVRKQYNLLKHEKEGYVYQIRSLVNHIKNYS